MDWNLPNSSVHGILQAGLLEWVAISFSRGSSWSRNWTWVSCFADSFFFFFKLLFIGLHGESSIFPVACTIFSCSMWDLVPWPGIEPRPPALELGVLASGPPGKSLQTDSLPNELCLGKTLQVTVLCAYSSKMCSHSRIVKSPPPGPEGLPLLFSLSRPACMRPGPSNRSLDPGLKEIRLMALGAHGKGTA